MLYIGDDQPSYKIFYSSKLLLKKVLRRPNFLACNWLLGLFLKVPRNVLEKIN